MPTDMPEHDRADPADPSDSIVDADDLNQTGMLAELHAIADIGQSLAVEVAGLAGTVAALAPQERVDRQVEHLRVDGARRRRLTFWLLAAGIVAAVNLHGWHVARCVDTSPSTVAGIVACQMTLPFTADPAGVGVGGAGGDSRPVDVRPVGVALYLAVPMVIATFEVAVRAADRTVNDLHTDADADGGS